MMATINLLLTIILDSLVVVSMIVMVLNHIEDDNIRDKRPAASVLTYWDADQIRYRWISRGILGEGFEGFTTREDAINNAEWNGYRVI